MATTIVVNSFRRGDGRSSLVANLSGLLAASGYRVCAVDADLQGPGLDIFFQAGYQDSLPTLNHYLAGGSEILDATGNVTPVLGALGPGELYLVRASSDPIDIIKFLRTPIDFDRLEQGFSRLDASLKLDYIVVDTMAGISADTLTLLATANRVITLLRPDAQDYQGASVLVELARSLGTPNVYVALNDAPPGLNLQQAWEELERTYQCHVAGILPHSEEILALGSAGILALSQPANRYSQEMRKLAERLIG
jgi:MinD-like ATPase involved in chromosome partitioning or flagellar assembly